MYDDKKREAFQKNFTLIRKVIGWSEEELGEHLGVTRQTINNIEKGRSNLTKTQYIAIRAILNEMIQESREENEMLIYVLEVLVDNPEKYTDEYKRNVLEKANLLAPAVIMKTSSKKEVSKEFKTILEAIGVGIGVAVTAGIAGFLGGHLGKGKK